jgi:hypothetical protein
MSDSDFCECEEPFWLQFPDGRIGCKRCRKPQGYVEVEPAKEKPHKNHRHHKEDA